MCARRREWAEEIQRSCADGRVLPGMAYRDPVVYEAEVERIFRDEWVSVACGQSLPDPGNLLPVEIAGYSLLVVRGDEDEIRVFYNLCRHRGGRLATAACRARAGRIVCPYHAWSYRLDGELAAAPHYHRGAADTQPDPNERARLGLIPLRSAVWRDIVFVNISGGAPVFDDWIRPLEQRIARWTESELRPLGADEYRIKANWKLAAENFLDVYHLPVVHAQIGLGFAEARLMQDVEISDGISGIAMPQGYGEGSGEMEVLLPRFPGLGAEDRLRVEVFSIFPNTLILVEPDNQQVIVLRPQAADCTEETFANYVVGDASQLEALAALRTDYYRQALEINDQDAVLLAGLQKSRSMDVGGQTRPAPAWDRTCLRFQRFWAERLLASG